MTFFQKQKNKVYLSWILESYNLIVIVDYSEGIATLEPDIHD